MMMSCLFVGVIYFNLTGLCLLAEQRRRNPLWFSHRSADERSGPTPAPTPAFGTVTMLAHSQAEHPHPHPFSQASENVIHYQQNPTSHSSQTFTPPTLTTAPCSLHGCHNSPHTPPPPHEKRTCIWLFPSALLFPSDSFHPTVVIY